jgi:hypothetical protein
MQLGLEVNGDYMLNNVKVPVFDAQAFLDSAGVARSIVEYRKSQKIYSQGDPTNNVLYIQRGVVSSIFLPCYFQPPSQPQACSVKCFVTSNEL